MRLNPHNRHRSRGAGLALAVLGLFLYAAQALGQPHPAPAAAQAQGRLRSASELSRAQREGEASYLRQPAPHVLLELGAIAAAQRELPAAADLYRRALSELPQATTPELQALIAEQERRGTEVSVVGPEGGALRVDGRLVGVLDRALPLLLGPGRRVLEMKHPQGGARLEMNITGGVPISVRFTLNQAVGPSQTETPQVLAVYGKSLMPPPEQLLLHSAVTAGVRGSGQAIAVAVERARVGMQAPEELCLADSGCLYELAQRLGALYILRISPAAAGMLAFELLDVAVRAVSVTGQAAMPADAASAASLRTQLDGWIQQALSRQVGEVNLTVHPADAVVRIDGQAAARHDAAQQPLRLSLFSGRHVVAVSRMEYTPLSREIDVAPGQPSDVDLTMTLEPTAVKRRRLAAGKWAMLAAGVAALAVGGALIGVHGTALTSDSTDQPKTQYLASQPHGIAAVCFGGLLLGGAGVLWGLERRAARQLEASAQR